MKSTENQRKESIASLCLMDKLLKKNVFKDPECTQLVLRTILKKDDIVIESVETEYEVITEAGVSVIYDILAKDTEGNYYNIEIPRNSARATPKHARFNSNVIDACIIDPAEDLHDFTDVYVIFIIENDMLGLGEPIYYKTTKIYGTDITCDDGSYALFVNQKIQDDTPLGKLMADFEQTDPSKFNYQVLAEKVRELKKTEIG